MLTPDNPITPDDTTPAPAPLLKLAWGLQPPANARLAWGARAIYSLVQREDRFFANGKRRKTPKSVTVASIDCVFDRQSTVAVEGVTVEEREAFGDWINKFAFPMLRAECVKRYLTRDSEDTIEIASSEAAAATRAARGKPAATYAMKASPRASYGYLYIVAWQVER